MGGKNAYCGILSAVRKKEEEYKTHLKELTSELPNRKREVCRILEDITVLANGTTLISIQANFQREKEKYVGH